MAKLYFRYSAMNAGKSTALLQVAHNYEVDLGEGVLVFTAAIDDRYGVGKVTSRLGISHDAETFDAKTNFTEVILRHIDQTLDINEEKRLDANGRRLGCILVDEAQFLARAQVSTLHKFAHQVGIPVICYGIRTDFSGIAFEGSATLLALADEIEELRSVCSMCKHRRATMQPRVDADGRRILQGPQVGIEGTAFTYAPMCPKCFYATETTI